MLVCACTRTTLATIQDLVDDGARTWLEASASCGAGRYCGGYIKTFRAAVDHCQRARTQTQRRRAEAPQAA